MPTQSTESLTNDTVRPLRLLVLLVLDYLRYLALAPMIVVWAYGLAMLGAILMINHLDSLFDALHQVAAWIASLPVVGEPFLRKMEAVAGDDGRIELGGNELKAAVMKVWGFVSLVFMILSLAISWIFGPFRPWTLKRKFGMLAMVCVAYWLILAVAYFIDTSQFNGPAWQWLLVFLGLNTVLFLWSVWFLLLAHGVGRVRLWVESS